VTSYVELLDHFESHAASVNRMLVRLLHRFFVTYKVQGLFYKVRLAGRRSIERAKAAESDRTDIWPAPSLVHCP